MILLFLENSLSPIWRRSWESSLTKGFLSLSLSILHSVTKRKKKCIMIKRRRVSIGEAKIGSLGISRSREAHMGRNPSNLMAKLNLELTLQVFETTWVDCKFLNFGVKIEKLLKLHGLKVKFPLNT